MMTGKKLVQLLRDSGTGVSKLEIARVVLRANPRATADDVLRALHAAALPENGSIVPEGTLAKAEQIATDGEYRPPVEASATPVEDLPDDDAPGEAPGAMGDDDMFDAPPKRSHKKKPTDATPEG